MATKKRNIASNSPEEWDKAGPSGDDYESLPSGLSPLWTPKEGETIFFRPDTVHPFKVKKGKKKQGKGNFAIEGIYTGGEGTFSRGKGKLATVTFGDRVTLGSSYNLIGPDRLINDGELSPMAVKILEAKKSFKIRFDGKVKTDNGRSVNQLDVAVPKGFRN